MQKNSQCHTRRRENLKFCLKFVQKNFSLQVKTAISNSKMNQRLIFREEELGPKGGA
jgi:hypothetical protein